MPASPSCLTGLVGLSRAASPCFALPVGTEEVPADNAFITESTTGRYVDKVEGLILRPASGQQPGSDAWARLDRARSQAIGFVEVELGKHLSAQTGPLKEPLGGKFGSLGDGSLLPLGTQPLLRLPTRLLPGRGYTLVSLSLYASAEVTDVPVLLDGVEIARVTTSATTPTMVYLQEGVTVPFDGQVHTLSAVLPEGVQARAGKLTCGCGDRNPDVALALTGLRGETLTSRYNQNAWNGGFLLYLETTCLDPSKLCYVLSTDDELQQSVAFAIQYKAAEYVVASLLADANYSRYTSLDVKALEFLAERYQQLNHATTEDSPGHLVWLTSPNGLARVAHPCYDCKPHPYAPRLVR
ncbi:hypothetical protein [Hymenobacter tenuis]